MMRSFVQILPADKTDRQPIERCRLHFFLAFLHAVILERLRYAPVGWSKKYEFSDSDQSCGRDVIDAWLDSVSQGGTMSNVSPEKIPWDAIQTVVSDAMYGGRVDNEFDQTILQSFIKHLFCEQAFNNDFALNLSLEAEHKLPSPDGRKREQFVAWCENLPVKGSPAWLGLPVHAERMLRINRAISTLSRWLKLQSSGGGGSAGGKKEDKKARRGSGGGNPLASVGEKVTILLGNMPEKLDAMEKTEETVKDPMWRCINRENEVCRSLIKKVRNDLKSLLGMCEGTIKATNDLRALLQNLSTDSVPKAWKKYVVPDTMTITDWISDFSARTEQLNILREAKASKTMIWFGGLMFPEAFLTATRQATALDMKLSLEELQLVIDVGVKPVTSNLAFEVNGLYIEGAKYDTSGEGHLALTDELAVPLPDMRLRWVHRDSKEYLDTLEFFKAPVYVNGTRTNLLCPFYIRAPKDTTQSVWLQRSVCITLWTKR
jgi:dynein heavy chain 1